MEKIKVIGRYHELQYEVVDFTNDQVLYTAGNSPLDSQGYVPAEDGVGIDTMKQYCEKTTRQIAQEQNAEYIGVEYNEDIDIS